MKVFGKALRLAASEVLLWSVLLRAAVPETQAQQPLSLADAELRGQALFEQLGVTGMVLVVVRNQEVRILSYGETFPGSGFRPTSNSLLRLCSISKVFAGELLSDLAAEGKLALGDPLQRFAPSNRKVPTRADGTPITLQDLVTHTSGLPREVGPYPAHTPHFTFPDQTYRWEWLSRQKLISAPGTAALYSNVAFDLLGDALAAAANQSYGQLLNERIVRPLGLRDTTLTPSIEQCGQLLRGVRDEGPCTDTQTSGASGGLYSTPADMARVLQHWLRIPAAAGTSAHVIPKVPMILKPATLKSVQGLSHAGDPTGIGLGWIQLGDPEGPSSLVQKTGGGAGFTTYVALQVQRRTGIFLAMTDGKGGARVSLYREANNLVAALADVPPLPVKAKPAVAATRRRARPHRPVNRRGL
jgi:serine-type D-Ala-D-Ala carboxypeptidase/endopeptidase